MDSLFYHFDCFKIPLTYRINGRRNFSTKFGCLMSIPLLTILMFLFCFNEIIMKQPPSISSISIVEEQSPVIYFNNSNIKFAFRVSNTEMAVDPTYYNLSIENILLNNTSHKIILTETKEIKPCEENELRIYGIPNASCLPDRTVLKTAGSWSDHFINYVRVSILPCQNFSNSEIICKSPEQIKNYFKDK